MDIQRWMDGFTAAVRDAFGARVRCIGLQGSHARGEARADSDIDAVVILDEWRAADWDCYRVLLDGLPERSRVCGFVSGWAELLAWEPSELFGFYYDTKPWYGGLEALKTRFGPADARRDKQKAGRQPLEQAACRLGRLCAPPCGAGEEKRQGRIRRRRIRPRRGKAGRRGSCGWRPQCQSSCPGRCRRSAATAPAAPRNW